MKLIAKGLLAATALVSLPSVAYAAVVVTNVNISVPNNTAGVYINLLTGLNGGAPSAAPGWDINAWGTSSLFFYAPTATGGIVVNGTTPADLAAGTLIGAGSTFAANPTAATAFLTGGEHVFGFRFLNEGTGATNYGYARITTTTGTTGRPATITQLAYDNAGAAILVVGNAGAVPEPATWAMMMLGFGAMGFAMRSRKTTTTARIRFA